MQSAQQGSQKAGSKYVLPPDYSFRFIWHRNHSENEKVERSSPSVTISDADEVVVSSNVEADDVSDTDRRMFLKALGVVGLGVVGASLLPEKASALVMGGSPATSVVGMKDSTNTRIDPATNTTLTGVKTQTDKLTFDGSSNLYVQAATNFSSQLENASNIVINPATEDTLAAIKTQTNKLNFDVSGNLLTAGAGGTASAVGIKDTTNTQVNPATDDSIVYLRRIVRLMESQAVVDVANRQRISLDAAPATVTVTGTVTANVAAGTNVIGGVTIDGQGRQQFTEIARQAYNSGIRSNLIFS